MVGVGRMGEFHVQKYLESSRCEVVGVHDTNLEKMRELKDRYGVAAYDNLADLLFDTDAVTISAATTSHFAIAKQALQYGNHILLEKPMCEDLGQAKELVAVAKENKKILQVGFVQRFLLRSLFIDTGDEPIYVDGQRLTQKPGREDSVSVVSDLMIHDIDLVLSLIQGKVKELSVLGETVVSSKCDVAKARLEFDSGAVVNLVASRVSPVSRRSIQIYTPSQAVCYDLLRGSVHTHVGKEGWVKRVTGKVDALKEEVSHFLGSCLGEVPAVATGDESVRVLKVVQLVQEQIERGDKKLGGVPIISQERQVESFVSDQ